MLRVPKYNKLVMLAAGVNALLLVVFVASLGNQPVQASPKACDIANVGGATSWVPVAHLNEDTNQAEGVGYRLVQQLASNQGIRVNLKPDYPWVKMMEMARAGELDIVAGLVSTPEREKYLHFTKPFYRDTLYAYVHRSSQIELNSVRDLLKYKRVEVKDNSVGQKLNVFLGESLLVKDERQRIAVLLAGRADYLLASQSEFLQFREKYIGWENLKQLSLPVKTLEVTLGVSKSSPCAKYLPEFNQAISELYATN